MLRSHQRILDEEKRKYFKITANHSAQFTGAKYTKSNVRHERQAAKKRKVEQRADKKRQAQTIKRSRLLALPQYAGLGLHREVGVRSHASDLIHADEAFISQLRYEHLHSAQSTVLSAHAIPSSKQTLLTQIVTNASISGDVTCVFTCPGDISHSSRTRRPAPKQTQPAVDPTSLIAAFADRVMSTSVWPANDPQKILVCAGSGLQNAYISSLRHDDLVPQPPVFLSLGTEETTLWDSAIAPTGSTAAISASDAVRHISLSGDVLSTLKRSADSRSLSWLNTTTIAAGASKTVLLWDTRAQGSTPRFSSPHTITGVQTVPSSSGTQLLVSTNYGLSLHDTRSSTSKSSKPLLHFPLTHEGPQLVFDVSKRDLVAVSAKNGARDEIRVLSLRTGREVRTLPLPKEVVKRPTQLAWREDERGVEFLQACIGERIGRWCWDDRGEDSDDA